MPVNLEGKKKKGKNHQDDLPVNGHQMGTRWIHFSAENLHELGNGRGCRKRAGRAVEKKKNHLKMFLWPNGRLGQPGILQTSSSWKFPGISPGRLVGSNEQSFPHLPPAPAPPSLSPQAVAQVPVQFSSVQSLSCVRLFAAHGLQHTRPPCPSPTPGVYSNPCPWSRWCHPAI